MRLAKDVTRTDVEEAHRLFRVSTMNAIKGGIALGAVAANPAVIVVIEEAIKRRIDIGAKISMYKLVEDLEVRHANVPAIHAAINNLVRLEHFDSIQDGKMLIRKK